MGNILVMGALECSICGHKTWIFPTNHELERSRCMECESTIHAIFNQEQIEINILNIQKEQI